MWILKKLNKMVDINKKDKKLQIYGYSQMSEDWFVKKRFSFENKYQGNWNQFSLGGIFKQE